MLGKAPARIDTRTLRLAKYLDRTALPAAPASCSWSHAVASYPMDGNDRYGDCTIAGVHHLIQTQRANDKQPALNITEGDVTKQYFALSGGQDTGLVELDVLNAWKTSGLLNGDKIGAFAAVNMHDANEVRTAIYLFGGIYLGVELPIAWQRAKKWTLPRNLRGNNAPGSWGGHCVIGTDYDATGIKVVTWGMLMQVGWSALPPYFSEGYVVIGPDWLGKDNTAPNGFNSDALTADLALL
jgi:hypothetical protein